MDSQLFDPQTVIDQGAICGLRASPPARLSFIIFRSGQPSPRKMPDHSGRARTSSAADYFLALQVGHVAQVAFASAQHFISQEAVFSGALQHLPAQPQNRVRAPIKATQETIFFMALVLVQFARRPDHSRPPRTRLA
jgi:hypothetical protein